MLTAMTAALLLQSATLPPAEPGLCWINSVMQGRLLGAVREKFVADLAAAKKAKDQSRQIEIAQALALTDQELAMARTVMGRGGAPSDFTDEFFKRYEDTVPKEIRSDYLKLCAA